ncbi:hypothetical protein FOR87_01205 [Bacillus anthracis]|nr:hypothetical protein [Bacillus anthracis]MDR4453053.1 hypothetical protein [Bacillus anthracis]
MITYMDTILVFEKEERYQYMIDTSTILNSMKSIKLFVKYTFNEQLFLWICFFNECRMCITT